MKKFITTIALQVSNLEKLIYKPAPGVKLEYNVENSYPILSAIKNTVSENEEIEIIPIIVEDKVNPEVAERNYQVFKDQLETLRNEIKFKYSIREPIIKASEDTYDSMIGMFSKLLDCVSDGDILNACISYGTKSIPILILMTLHYAYKVKENVTIKHIVYGNVHWADKNRTVKVADLFEVTPLFYIDSAIESLAKLNLTNPEIPLRAMLGVDKDE